MPPSGNELILKLLSQSVARLESGDKKRKQEEEEEIGSKKVKKDLSEVGNTNNTIIEALVVYQHMHEISPKLAEELSSLHIFGLVSKHLQKVSPELAEQLTSIQNKKLEKQKPANRTTGIIRNKFTKAEDEVLHAAIKQNGKDIDAASLAKTLKRPFKSVFNRINSLIRNGGVNKPMKFTLVEDILILETLIIPRVGSEKMSEIDLHPHQYADLTEQLGKSHISVRQRWTFCLQPWLLQHYSGTLNLRVERMLANYISDTFTDFSSINWLEVVDRSEFAGHTERSLRQMYFKLSNATRGKFVIQQDDVKPKHIGEYCELVYGNGATGKAKGRLGPKKLTHQRDVISFFERRMVDLKLKNFI